jgi:hypothetical protein
MRKAATNEDAIYAIDRSMSRVGIAMENIFRASGMALVVAKQFKYGNPVFRAMDTLAKLAKRKGGAEAAEIYAKLGNKEFQEKVQKFIYDIIDAKSPEEETRLLQQFSKFITQEVPVDWREWLTNFRYNNMLGPTSWMKKGLWDVIQTFITEPLILTFETKDIGALKAYFTAVGKSFLPKSLVAKFGVKSLDTYGLAAEAFIRGLGRIPPGEMFLETLKGEGALGEDIIKRAQMAAMPFWTRFNTQMIGAIYNSFAITLSEGIKAAKIKALENAGKPLTESVLKKIEFDTIDEVKELLLTKPLGKDLTDAQKSYLIRGLDAMGVWIDGLRHSPVVGLPAQIAVPFLRMGVNFSKSLVEFTPIDLVFGGQITSKRIAKAAFGSALMTFIGYEYLANENAWPAGIIAWQPPKDENLRKAWYASGRQPFSIRVGGHWIPMGYFGPFGLALAMPGILAISYDEAKTKPGMDRFAALAEQVVLNSLQFITEHVPIEQAFLFSQTIGGGSVDKIPTDLAYIGGQFIPYNSWLRYITKLVDPVLRETGTGVQGFINTLKKQIPWLSKTVNPVLNPDGTPVTFSRWQMGSPYRYGNVVASWDEVYNMEHKRSLEQKAIKEQSKMAQKELPEDIKKTLEEEKNTKLIAMKYLADIDLMKKQGKSKEEIVNYLKKELTNLPNAEKVYKKMLEIKNEEKTNIKLPEGFTMSMKHWTVRDRAIYILYWLNQHKSTMDKSQIMKSLKVLSQEGILTKNVYVLMVKLKKQSKKEGEELKPMEIGQ